MAETAAITGLGTTFAMAALTAPGSPPTEVAEMIDIGPPERSTPTIDATHYKSTGAEFILGLPDNGEAVVTLAFIPGNGDDELVNDAWEARERRDCLITWPNGATWAFRGLVTNIGPAAPIDDRMTQDVTIKVTGSILRAPPAP